MQTMPHEAAIRCCVLCRLGAGSTLGATHKFWPLLTPTSKDARAACVAEADARLLRLLRLLLLLSRLGVHRLA